MLFLSLPNSHSKMSQFHTQSPLHHRYHKYLSTPHPRLKMHWWQLGMIYPPQSTGPCPEYKIVHFSIEFLDHQYFNSKWSFYICGISVTSWSTSNFSVTPHSFVSITANCFTIGTRQRCAIILVITNGIRKSIRASTSASHRSYSRNVLLYNVFRCYKIGWIFLYYSMLALIWFNIDSWFV